jgi:phytoene dehydrogenase-like protein
MDSPDVVVVGGGITGLAVAAECAKAAQRVLLLEAASELGGRARTTVHEGYHLNLGPRALYRGHGLRLLHRHGVRPVGGAPARGLVLLDGELHRGFLDAAGLLSTPLLSVRERASLVTLLAGGGPTRALAGRSALDWLTGRLPSSRAVAVAATMARVASYVPALDAISADAVAGHLRLARSGVRYIDGGWAELVGALARAARRHGAQIRTGSRVVAVEPGRRVRVRLRAGEMTASCVVLAGLPPREVGRLLSAEDTLAEAAGPGQTASCLDVALARLPRPGQPFVVGLDEPVYLSAHSVSARLAPDGGAVIHVLRYHDRYHDRHHDQAGSRESGYRAELERLLDTVQPGWRDVLVHARFLPRMNVCGPLPRPGMSGLAGRPATVATDRPGLFLAGDWIGPSGLLLEASLASARQAARAALLRLAS